MLVIVDDRNIVTNGYASGFRSEGVSASGFEPQEFQAWVATVAEADLKAVEAFVIGDCRCREALPRLIRERSRAPIIVMNETHSLERTLELFAAGVDDVVRKPIHVRELMARIGAIRRRSDTVDDSAVMGEMRVFFDGRDPEVRGETFALPRREKRILEFLVRHRGKRVNKSQIFNSIYGIFDEDVEENVVESHVSKLRKKLRQQLGYDPIDSKRYLGYCFENCDPAMRVTAVPMAAEAARLSSAVC